MFCHKLKFHEVLVLIPLQNSAWQFLFSIALTVRFVEPNTSELGSKGNDEQTNHSFHCFSFSDSAHFDILQLYKREWGENANCVLLPGGKRKKKILLSVNLLVGWTIECNLVYYQMANIAILLTWNVLN